MININFGFKKMLTFTQPSAKFAQNHFQLHVKERKPSTHMRGLKCQQHLPNHNSTLKTVFAAGQTENRPSSSSKQTSIHSLTENEAAKKAEIMWALEVVIAKHSFRSCGNKSELFSSMFPDRQVTKTFAYWKTKCKYLVCHGIAPYFKKVLIKSLMELEHYFCLFDEPYNNIVKKGQMDMHIQYWDKSLNTVKARYYNSQFLGKSAAKDVLKTYKECVNSIDEDKLLQDEQG